MESKKQSAKQFSDRPAEMGSQKVLKSIVAGHMRFGFTLCAVEKKERYLRLARGFYCSCEKPVASIPLYAMVFREYPLYRRPSVSIKELSGYPYIHSNDISATSYLKLVGLSDYSNCLEVDNRGQLFDTIREDQYISLSIRGKASDGRGFCFVSISDKNLYLSPYFVAQTDYRSNKREQEFIRFLRDFVALDRQTP